MKIFLVVLIIFLVILFFPLRLKFTFLYSENNYYIKFYKFKIVSKEKPLKNETKKHSIPKKAKPNQKKQKDNDFINNLSKSFSPTILFKYINLNTFKPKIKLQGALAYSLGDSSKTAISYGLISFILPFLHKLISVIFKIKKMDLPINPQFTDKFLLNIDITSIIYLSFAQVIYVIFLILKSIVYSKEANLKRENL